MASFDIWSLLTGCLPWASRAAKDKLLEKLRMQRSLHELRSNDYADAAASLKTEALGAARAGQRDRGVQLLAEHKRAAANAKRNEQLVTLCTDAIATIAEEEDTFDTVQVLEHVNRAHRPNPAAAARLDTALDSLRDMQMIAEEIQESCEVGVAGRAPDGDALRAELDALLEDEPAATPSAAPPPSERAPAAMPPAPAAPTLALPTSHAHAERA